MATIIFDINKIVVALREGEATPDQQLDAACMLVLMKNGLPVDWDNAERSYLSLKVSGFIAVANERALEAEGQPFYKCDNCGHRHPVIVHQLSNGGVVSENGPCNGRDMDAP